MSHIFGLLMMLMNLSPDCSLLNKRFGRKDKDVALNDSIHKRALHTRARRLQHLSPTSPPLIQRLMHSLQLTNNRLYLAKGNIYTLCLSKVHHCLQSVY